MRLEITLGTVCARGYLCKSLSLNDLHKRGPQRKPLTDKGLRWSFFLDKEKNGSVSMGSQRTRCKISLHTMLPFTYVTNQQKSNKNKISLWDIFFRLLRIFFDPQNVETNFVRKSSFLQRKSSGPKHRDFRTRRPPTRGRQVRRQGGHRGRRHPAVGLVQRLALSWAGQGTTTWSSKH